MMHKHQMRIPKRSRLWIIAANDLNILECRERASRQALVQARSGLPEAWPRKLRPNMPQAPQAKARGSTETQQNRLNWPKIW
jgi:hypothetical protein